MDKFIHHERCCAISASADGESGCYDVIEDDHGIYVNNANEGCLARYATVAEAVENARDLADRYDAKHLPNQLANAGYRVSEDPDNAGRFIWFIESADGRHPISYPDAETAWDAATQDYMCR